MMVQTKAELRAWHKEQALWLRKRLEYTQQALLNPFNREEAVDLEARVLKLTEEAELHESAAEVLKEEE